MSVVNEKVTYVLFLTTILSCIFAIMWPILELPSEESGEADQAGAFVHPLIVLVVYKTILLRGRAGGDRILGVERHVSRL